ncbi:MAG TPA: FUSC family protein [Micromonosporaceae bacterium]|nr:FUSC family protein [Micromonosporaceae bacterium]
MGEGRPGWVARRVVSVRGRVRTAKWWGRRAGRTLRESLSRGRAVGRERLKYARSNALLILQAGTAATLGWLVSHLVLHSPDPVFAPVTAVATVAAAQGRRLRRTAELIAGVGVGIAVGDLLIALIGTGAWQTGLTVALAVFVAILLKGGTQLISRAGGTAVLIATLSPAPQQLEVPRFINAVAGGIIGLAVVLVLLPLRPLRVVEQTAAPLLKDLAKQLHQTAQALSERDADRAQGALKRIRDTASHRRKVRKALRGAHETTTLTPARRHRRTLAQYQHAFTHIDRALHDVQPLISRSVTLLNDREPVPESLPYAVAGLGDALRQLRGEFTSGREPEKTRERTLQAVREAGRAYDEGVGFSGSVVVAQVRATATEILRAMGFDQTDAVRLVRRAVSHKTTTGARFTPRG